MGIQEKAQAYHASGCNCAQSVLCACSEYTGLDEQTAKNIAAAFGAGMRCGEVCGAVTGALMAVGAAGAAPMAKNITGSFKDKYEYIRCSDLLRAAQKRRCSEFIAYCAGLAEETILEQKQK